jgi:NAD+ kinase
VNVGQLGYLAEVEPDGLDDALERIVSGDFTVEERTTLEIRVASDGPAAGSWTALNEMVLEKRGGGGAVRLDVAVNGATFTTYVADGVIVATPTGSTAYAFSAGGPIVSPRLGCFLLVPVAPHMLFDRALVLDGDEELTFRVVDRPALLAIDGRAVTELQPGDGVSCTAGMPARLAVLEPRDFHQILRAKFGLTDR